MMMVAASATNLLFVPADRPDRIKKALSAGADLVVADLEDAVVPEQKVVARQALADFLDTNSGVSLAVRINSSAAAENSEDMALCERYESIAAIMVPKAEGPESLPVTAKPLLPLIETARGLVELPRVVRAQGVQRLCLGALDLCADLGLRFGDPGTNTILDYCRMQLLVHSVAQKLPAPMDSVHPELNDMEVIRSSAERARALGLTGMMCIHPKQVAVVKGAFLPDPEERAWAENIVRLANENNGVFEFQGKMVDEPVIVRARRILANSPESPPAI